MGSFYSDKTCLVTGGDGFIGRHLVRALRNAGVTVRSFDREDGDLRRTDVALAACRGMDVVFHLAAKVAGIQVYQRWPWSIADHNLTLDQSVIHGAVYGGVKYFFYASSSHVDTDLSYGWAKRTGEKLLEWVREEHKKFGGVRTAIGRICGAYGPGQNIDLEDCSLIPALCHRAAAYPAESYSLQTDGQERRSYCYVTDVIEAMMRSVEALDEAPSIGPINIASSEIVTVGWIARTIAEISGKAMGLISTDLPGSIPCQAPSADDAERLLGWKPRVSLSEGLRRTYEDVANRVGVACA